MFCPFKHLGPSSHTSCNYPQLIVFSLVLFDTADPFTETLECCLSLNNVLSSSQTIHSLFFCKLEANNDDKCREDKEIQGETEFRPCKERGVAEEKKSKQQLSVSIS